MKTEKGSYFQRACYVWKKAIDFILACGALIRCVQVLRKIWVLLAGFMATLYPVMLIWWDGCF